jgi:LPXTG-motif cell wall-anchored protein
VHETTPTGGGETLPRTGAQFPIGGGLAIALVLLAAGALLRWRDLIALAYRRRH